MRKRLPSEILQVVQVRVALLQAALDISEKCFETLSELVPSIVELFALHLFDDFEEVSSLSRKGLEVLASIIGIIISFH